MQPIPYNFQGKQTYKQIHLLCDKLDNHYPRIWNHLVCFAVG